MEEASRKQGSAERTFRKSGLDGLSHLLAYTNLKFGKESLGERIMNFTMYKPGPVDNPKRFAVGFAIGVVAEVGFFVYSIYKLVADGDPDCAIANAYAKISLRLVYDIAKDFRI